MPKLPFVNSGASTDDVIAADERKTAANSKVDASIRSRKVGRIKRYDNYTPKAAISGVEGARQLHRALAGYPSYEWPTDKKFI